MEYAYTYICICASDLVLLRWWFSGNGPLIFNLSVLLCWHRGHAQYILLHATSHTCTHVRKHSHHNTRRISSAQRRAIWWVVTGGSQLCPSCLCVTVTDLFYNYCPQTADGPRQQLMGHLHTAAHLSEDMKERLITLNCEGKHKA